MDGSAAVGVIYRGKEGEAIHQQYYKRAGQRIFW
jgi:hypothetical protein